MPDNYADYVSKEQFLDLKEEMAEGFAEIRKSQADLDHKLEMMIATLKSQNDERYAQQKDEMSKALLRLDDPVFITKAMNVCDHWVATERGKDAIIKVIHQCFNDTRDGASKWISFVKLIVGTGLSVFVAYLGITIINSQKALALLVEQIK